MKPIKNWETEVRTRPGDGICLIIDLSWILNVAVDQGNPQNVLLDILSPPPTSTGDVQIEIRIHIFCLDYIIL